VGVIALIGGRVYLGGYSAWQEALLIRGDRIAATGTNEEVLSLAGGGAEVVNLGGRTVLPGFIDTHVHFTSTGHRLLQTDLSGARSVHEVVALLLSNLPSSEAVPAQGYGLNYHHFKERRYPSLEEMDEAFPARPAFAFDQSGHAVITNTAGMNWLGRAGVALKEESARTGTLTRQDAYRAREVLIEADPAREGLEEAWQAAAQAALRVGITTVHALEGPLGDLERCTRSRLESIIQLSRAAPLRVVLYYQTLDIRAVLEAGLPRIGGCILVDGAFSPWTAALYEPYHDNTSTSGTLYIPHQDLLDFVYEAHRAGLQVSLHACGDRAIGECLEAYASALERIPRSGHRHRIEHFEIPTHAQITEASRLGICLGMQPAFDRYWDMDCYRRKLGDERARRKNAFRSILGAGITVGGGSDSEVTPMNPLLGVYSAVMSSNLQERIGVREALEMFGNNAARLSFDECRIGSIDVGKAADLVILSGDPLTVVPESLISTRVEATMVGGEFRYRAPGWE